MGKDSHRTGRRKPRTQIQIAGRPPFLMVPAWLVLRADIRPSTVQVWLALWHCADWRASRAAPSRAKLATITGLSLPTVKRSLRALERLGALVRTQRSSSAGDPDTTLYELVWDPDNGSGGGVRVDPPCSANEGGVGSPVTPPLGSPVTPPPPADMGSELTPHVNARGVKVDPICGAAQQLPEVTYSETHTPNGVCAGVVTPGAASTRGKLLQDAHGTWLETWEACGRGRYQFLARDHSALKAVLDLAEGDLAEIRRRAELLVGSQDRWLAQNASPSMLLSRWNQLAVEVRERPRPHQMPASATSLAGLTSTPEETARAAAALRDLLEPPKPKPTLRA